MRGRALFRFFAGWVFVLVGLGAALAGQPAASSPATFVQSLLDAPVAELDFARAKLAIDAFVDPSIDQTAALAEIDRMRQRSKK